MPNITKKELVDAIAQSHDINQRDVKVIIQAFLDGVIAELGKGNRLEFRDFGVFEVRARRARQGHNPKTQEKVAVPPRKTVKFKVGRLMKQALGNPPTAKAAKNPKA